MQINEPQSMTLIVEFGIGSNVRIRIYNGVGAKRISLYVWLGFESKVGIYLM